MARDEIVRRLARMTGPKNVKRMKEITRKDVAKWMNVDERLIRMHIADVQAISDTWQIAYTHFFALLDAGEIALSYDGGKKVLVRVAKPAEPPRRSLRPYIDFSDMRLRFDT